MKKLIKYLISYDFWQDYKREQKLKGALEYFFDHEDSELQELFLKNFTYPQDMTQKPVRYNTENGDIYYVINFKSKELFMNEATIETAWGQSMSILQQNLPLGVTDFLTPEIIGREDGSWSIVVSLMPMYDATLPKNIKNTIIKHAITTVGFIGILSTIIYYVI